MTTIDPCCEKKGGVVFFSQLVLDTSSRQGLFPVMCLKPFCDWSDMWSGRGVGFSTGSMVVQQRMMGIRL